MNMSFMLAGSASTNPVLFTLAVGLILAWKVAGYYGLDRGSRGLLLAALGVSHGSHRRRRGRPGRWVSTRNPSEWPCPPRLQCEP